MTINLIGSSRRVPPSPLDCLIVGHAEEDAAVVERRLARMGRGSCAHRTLLLECVRDRGREKTLGDILGNINRCDPSLVGPTGFFEMFSATIGYLGTYLHRRGYSFDYVLSFRDEQARLVELLQRHPKAVAVTTTYYVSSEVLAEVIAFIRDHAPATTVIVGGPFVANQTRSLDANSLEYLLQQIGADIYVNSSQGEATLVQILSALHNGAPWDAVENIYYFQSGELRASAPKVEDNDLTQNWTDWRLFSDRIGRFVHLRSAISCPFACAFCSFPELAGDHRVTSLQALESELDALDEATGLRGIQFVDDTFNVPKGRYLNILDLLIKRKRRLHWFANYRCQYADEQSVALMWKAGCRVVFLGLESGSDMILNEMNKRTTSGKYRRGIEMLRRQGIITFGSFIIGYPGETTETVEETANFIRSSGLDFFRINLWYCDRTTPVWARRHEYGLGGDGFAWKHRSMSAQQACAHLERLFLDINSPVWLPLRGFDIGGAWQLLEGGIDRDRIVDIVNVFNQAVRARLLGDDDAGEGVEHDIAARLGSTSWPSRGLTQRAPDFCL